MKNNVKLGALFYPIQASDGSPIDFDNLYIPYIYREIYFEGIYVDILNGRKDMVIVDVGSNVGVTVQHFQNYAKKVYAIEPLSTHYEALKKNKEFNNWDNVETFKLAIAGKDGEVTMHPLKTNMTCTSYTNDYGQGGETVEAQTMETFFTKNNIDQVDFMKFDVEGAEDDILFSDGFIKVADKINAIEIEFHHANWTDLVKHMIGLGFEARRYDSSAIIVMFVRK
jgi:FkbM family methyltransferase